MAKIEDMQPHWTKTYAINLYAKDIEMIDAARGKITKETGKQMSRSRFIADAIRAHLGYELELKRSQNVRLFNVNTEEQEGQ